MFESGDVITADIPGITGFKRRPAVVVSTRLYHDHRPDIIVGLITTQVWDSTSPTDAVLQDWARAGLRRPSAFRAFLATLPATAVTRIGRCSARNWQAIQACLEHAIAVREGHL